MIGSLKRRLFRWRAVYEPIRLARRVVRRVRERVESKLATLGITPERRERAITLAKSALVIVAFLYPSWLLHRYYFYQRIQDVPLSMACAFLATEGCAIGTQLLISCLAKGRTARRRARSEKVLPAIRAHLAAQAQGEDRREQLAALQEANRVDVESCLTGILSMVSGTARERLCRLAIWLGYRSRWEALAFQRGTEDRRHAAFCLGLLGARETGMILHHLLEDPSPLVQAAACRALVESGDAQDWETVFRFCLEGPLLVRIMMAGSLRVHAVSLAARAIPEELAASIADTGSRDRGLAVLELVDAWKVSLGMATLAPLLVHSDPRIRAGALRALPHQTGIRYPELWVLDALSGSEDCVRAAAAEAAARMQLRAALPSLTVCLREDNDSLARAAGRALARMGPEGWVVLQDTIREGSRPVAARALEALATAQLRPAEAAV